MARQLAALQQRIGALLTANPWRTARLEAGNPSLREALVLSRSGQACQRAREPDSQTARQAALGDGAAG